MTLAGFHLLMETAPDKTGQRDLLRRLINGDDTLPGPGLSFARWIGTAHSAWAASDPQTQDATQEDFLARIGKSGEGSRRDWFRYKNGELVPPVASLRRDLERLFRDRTGSALYRQLDVGLFLALSVARFHDHLRKLGVKDPAQPLQLALASVDRLAITGP